MTPTAQYVIGTIYPAAFALLPPQMNSGPALAMLTAVALQESRFEHRRQMGHGPARGFWQFETGGVRGVLRHTASRASALAVCAVLGYDPDDVAGIHEALADNDVMACCFARLLLWTDARMLPQGPAQSVDGWAQYLACWRPGKPHASTWGPLFASAWAADLPGTVRA